MVRPGEDLPFELDDELADYLEALAQAAWDGEVWRHMFGTIPPETSNIRGARWNPPQTAAIYASLERSTVLAEAEHAMSAQSVRPSASRRLYRIRVRLSSVIDLTDPSRLRDVGLDGQTLADKPYLRTQQVGGTVAWLGRDGLIVPSARAPGNNLVIFTANRDETSQFEEVETEEL